MNQESNKIEDFEYFGYSDRLETFEFVRKWIKI